MKFSSNKLCLSKNSRPLPFHPIGNRFIVFVPPPRPACDPLHVLCSCTFLCCGKKIQKLEHKRQICIFRSDGKFSVEWNVKYTFSNLAPKPICLIYNKATAVAKMIQSEKAPHHPSLQLQGNVSDGLRCSSNQSAERPVWTTSRRWL